MLHRFRSYLSLLIKKKFQKTVILLSGIYRGFLWNEISLVNVTHRRSILNLGFGDDHVSFKKKKLIRSN